MRLALSHAGCHAPPPISHVRRMGGILPSQDEIVDARAGVWRRCADDDLVFYGKFERHAHGEGLKAHSTTLLPRLRPRPGPEVPGRGHRRAGRPGPHRPGLAGRLLGVRVLLLRRRATPRPPTAAPRRWRSATSWPTRTRSSSATRATATWPPSAWPRSSPPPSWAIPITVIFINNAIYGMTGGQMAPTTLMGQRTDHHAARAGPSLPASR